MQKEPNILTEGESYLFLIHNKVILPAEDQEAFILIGPNNKKHLMNASYYTLYHFSIGQTIKCTVDKINCSGQIFLEPEHPYYQSGEVYNFLVVSLASSSDAWGNVMHTAWIRDLHGKDWPCHIDDPINLVPGHSHLSCRVNRIKKAELHLTQPSFMATKVRLQIGEYYHFNLVDEKEHTGKVYYVLEDPDGRYHLILKDFYWHFNFNIGQFIHGRVIALRPDGTYKIEPDNPFYQVGETYYFRFLRMEVNFNPFGEQTKLIWLGDHFGQENKVMAHSWQKDRPFYKPEKILCKVIKFKKGKLHLQNLETKPKN